MNTMTVCANFQSRLSKLAGTCLPCVAAVLVAGALVLEAAPVQAYAEPDSFGVNVLFGGGGAKFFTGSHAEGYTCQVCHSGGTSPAVTVIGLPVDGYEPGQIYRITVDWPDDLRAVGLNVEMTDAAGDRFGELVPIDPKLLSAADLCSNAPASNVAQFDLSNQRRILAVANCGQHQTTVEWRAPTQVTQGWFSGSLVASNRKKNVEGDGVTNISRVFGVKGAPAPLAGDLAAGCSALHERSSAACAWFGWLLVAGAWLLRRRR
jgi:uncharacterized protein (TIGR03382 family)